MYEAEEYQMSIAHEPRLVSGFSGNRRLSPEECTAWLRQHTEGRLCYRTGRGPRGVVVRYALSGDRVTFRLPDYNDVAHFAPGEPVTLTVDGRATQASGHETVDVCGTARLAEPGSTSPVEEAQLDETWPNGVTTVVLELPIDSVSGVVQQAGSGRADSTTGS